MTGLLTDSVVKSFLDQCYRITGDSQHRLLFLDTVKVPLTVQQTIRVLDSINAELALLIPLCRTSLRMPVAPTAGETLH